MGINFLVYRPGFLSFRFTKSYFCRLFDFRVSFLDVFTVIEFLYYKVTLFLGLRLDFRLNHFSCIIEI